MTNPAPPNGVFDPGSFRDPSSRVLHRGDRVLRTLSPEGLADWRALEISPQFAEWVSSGLVIETSEIDDNGTILLEHARVPFWSYPYEWSFSMLRDAARDSRTVSGGGLLLPRLYRLVTHDLHDHGRLPGHRRTRRGDSGRCGGARRGPRDP